MLEDNLLTISQTRSAARPPQRLAFFEMGRLAPNDSTGQEGKRP